MKQSGAALTFKWGAVQWTGCPHAGCGGGGGVSTLHRVQDQPSFVVQHCPGLTSTRTARTLGAVHLGDAVDTVALTQCHRSRATVIVIASSRG